MECYRQTIMCADLKSGEAGPVREHLDWIDDDDLVMLVEQINRDIKSFRACLLSDISHDFAMSYEPPITKRKLAVREWADEEFRRVANCQEPQELVRDYRYIVGEIRRRRLMSKEELESMERIHA